MTDCMCSKHAIEETSSRSYSNGLFTRNTFCSANDCIIINYVYIF